MVKDAWMKSIWAELKNLVDAKNFTHDELEKGKPASQK
jgi:hypothetical protein